MKSKKSQVLVEFLILFAVTLVIFLSISVMVFQERTRAIAESENTNLQAFALRVQSELLISSTMLDGFSRVISLEEKINDKTYALQIISSNLYVTQGEQQIILPLPTINGTISARTFTITKDASGMRVS